MKKEVVTEMLQNGIKIKTPVYSMEKGNIQTITRKTDNSRVPLDEEAASMLKDYKDKFNKFIKKDVKHIKLKFPIAIKKYLLVEDVFSRLGDECAHNRVTVVLNELNRIQTALQEDKISTVKVLYSKLENVKEKLDKIQFNENKLLHAIDKACPAFDKLKVVTIPDKKDKMFWVEAPLITVVKGATKNALARLYRGLGMERYAQSYCVFDNVPFIVVRKNELNSGIDIKEQINTVVQALNRKYKGVRYLPVYHFSRKIRDYFVVLLCEEDYALDMDVIANACQSFQIYVE